ILVLVTKDVCGIVRNPKPVRETSAVIRRADVPRIWRLPQQMRMIKTVIEAANTRVRIAVVSRKTKPPEESWERAEVLQVGDLEAKQVRAARVHRLGEHIPTGRITWRRIVEQYIFGIHDGGVQTLVEQAGLNRPERFHVVLKQNIVVIGGFGFQILVAETYAPGTSLSVGDRVRLGNIRRIGTRKRPAVDQSKIRVAG